MAYLRKEESKFGLSNERLRLQESARGDEDIFNMCREAFEGTEDGSTMSGCPSTASDPFGYSMAGSTININQSDRIHIGPKIETPSSGEPSLFSQGSAFVPTNFSSVPSSHSQESTVSGFTNAESFTSNFRNVDSSSFTNVDSVSMNSSSSISTINSQFQNLANLSDIHPRMNSGVEYRIPFENPTSSFTENNSEARSYTVKINNNTDGRNTQTSTLLEDKNNKKILKQSSSTPLSNQRASYSGSSTDFQQLQCQTIKNSGEMGHNRNSVPQLEANISGSRDVQVGTQIVYNYIISQPERSPSGVSSSNDQLNNPVVPVAIPSQVNNSSTDDDYLKDFRDKLMSVYQKRTRSSMLPWHRQVIPINEYYTEPQIFSIDHMGKRTTETVNIISILNSTDEKTRLLVEGEAGMGKTLLATKLAEEWARGQSLQQFKILILITLGDFKGSLQQYVKEELLPSYFEPEKFEKVWEYCKSHDREILFVLDGFDELQRHDKCEIQNLLKSKDFPDSKVVVTSRPNILQDWERKIVVSGFGQIQVMEFIAKYFRAIGNDSSGISLRKLIEKDDKYWNLAKRPLFCVLLCMLYFTGDVGESLPKRQSDVILQIILCLIKWNRKNSGNSAIDFDSLPPEYEKPFFHFGKLCLDALKTDKTRFTDKEVKAVDGFESKLQDLGFLFNDNESHALGEKKFWKPVHQTFLEYLGAFYMAKHLRDCKSCKECSSYSNIFQRSPEVLKFCVGILNNKAYRVIDGQRFPFLWKLPVTKVLHLLKEAEPRSENCLAVAKLLDQSTVEVSTSEIEFEGWSLILAQPFSRLSTLKLVWRITSNSPDQESSFKEASEEQYKNFFEALSKNDSIKSIHVRAKHDGEPFTDEKIAMFFSHLKATFTKKNLQELQIVEMKMFKASKHLREALENVPLIPDLKLLKLHTFMEDKDLMGICEHLQKCTPALESLHLEGLEYGNGGFQNLVKLLKSNNSIKYLHISMNQSLFVNFFGRDKTENKEDYPPVQMRTELNRIMQTAIKINKVAFAEPELPKESELPIPELKVHLSQELSPDIEDSTRRGSRESSSSPLSSEIDPRKELSYLFEKLDMSVWGIKAHHHWYLRKSGCDLRIPLPVCIAKEHKSVFHYLFSALPDTHVQSLTLSQAGLYLSTSDLRCLGKAVRKATHLSTLNLQGLDKVESYLPLLIGIGQSSSLTKVNISSSKVVLNDTAFEVACLALENNTSLRHLSIGRWQFHLKNQTQTFERVCSLFSAWRVTQLDLQKCQIDMSDPSILHSPPQTPNSPSCTQPLVSFFSSRPTETSGARINLGTLKSIALEGVEFKESSCLVRRGHLLLPGIISFANLTCLDLSILQTRPIEVDNLAARLFFGIIGSELKHLSDLKLDSWVFRLQLQPEVGHEQGGHDLSAQLKSCQKLKKVQLERVNEILSDEPSDSNNISSWCKRTFLHQLVSYTPHLEELSLCYYRINKRKLDPNLAKKISTCLHDHRHQTPFSVKFFNLNPEIDNIIYQNLKKQSCKVKRSSGPSLMRTYSVRYIIIHNLKKRKDKFKNL